MDHPSVVLSSTSITGTGTGRPHELVRPIYDGDQKFGILASAEVIFFQNREQEPE